MKLSRAKRAYSKMSFEGRIWANSEEKRNKEMEEVMLHYKYSKL